jgi:hypothetical protein
MSEELNVQLEALKIELPEPSEPGTNKEVRPVTGQHLTRDSHRLGQ